ncbi:shikimate kinase [Candidatus Halobonum tyrrellensis]|uniref:Shikimate kinase n=1 Tax=Candidatus Halobonum tyrrellensis G22 TaxID=1324957 RepID=V4GU83_9EURY|nr:shikimate kinase [Candidatus Halobonum tyrrellensis]ESP88691.1 shikimate kinase [Candidatus Halobonum tyrrellensis G22]
MQGRAAAPGAGTVVNAIATGVGSAFALDIETTAEVTLDPDAEGVEGTIAGAPDGDTSLVERCVEFAVAEYGADEGGTVRTESDVPTAAGLKSSSAAANAAVLATLDALGLEVADDPDADVTGREACLVGVAAARDIGVTVTGAVDDAMASMLGGVVVTDSADDSLLAHDPFEREAVVWTPPARAYSADTDVERCRRVAPMADLATELAMDGEYGRAMTVNGLAFSAALDFPTDPAVEAMPDCAGVTLSGTGPSMIAVGAPVPADGDAGGGADVEGGADGGLERVRERWARREGETRTLRTRNRGAVVR